MVLHSVEIKKNYEYQVDKAPEISKKNCTLGILNLIWLAVGADCCCGQKPENCMYIVQHPGKDHEQLSFVQV